MLLAGCASTPRQPSAFDLEVKNAFQVYYSCSAHWTKKYVNADMEAIEIANAAVSKCEPQLLSLKTAIRNDVNDRFTPGSDVWVKMMNYADERAVNTRNNVIRKSLAYQIELKNKE